MKATSARDLLVRGMIAGVIGAIVATVFARAVGEPSVDLAIAFEAAHTPHMAGMHEVELVSRAMQRGIGLLTAVTLYGAASGGIFALVFAALYGRIARIGPRTLALLLAIAAFTVIALVPALKYPPTPPAVGLHETVAFRTLAYFAAIAVSVAAMIAATRIGRMVAGRGIGRFDALLAAAASYLLLTMLAYSFLPAIDEVPTDFPAVTLWDFRIASLGMQAALWAVIGTSFGYMAERRLRRREFRPS